MADANDHSTSGYDRRNRTWDELPPKRRRFYFWLFVLLFLLSPLGRIPLEMVGTSSFVAAMIILGLSVAILMPLGWQAWKELQQRRASGEELPSGPVKGKTVVAWVVATLLSWSAVAFVAAESRVPFIPLIPVLCTFVAVRRFMQWRRQRISPAAAKGSG
jgi:CHASE2 domain-containing sensor protein